MKCKQNWIVCAAVFLVWGGWLCAAEPAGRSLQNGDAIAETQITVGEPSAPNAKVSQSKAGTPFDAVFKILERGGPVMYVLLATSIIGLTFVLERLVSLRRARHIPKQLIEQVEKRIREKGTDGARHFLKGDASALAIVLDGILARKGATREEKERVLEDETGRVLWDMRLLIRPVGIVASVAPLIGLLGTVFGLISAFQLAAEFGMDDPKKFASGIYEALYTTAFGLTVAIPFLVFYHYLRGKADVIIREVEDLAIRFIIETREGGDVVPASVPAENES